MSFDRPAGLSEAGIEAAIRTSYEREPQWTDDKGAGYEGRRPKTYEECYGCSPLDNEEDRENMEVAVSAYLAAGPTEDEIERMTRVVYRGTGPGSIFPWENVDEPSKKAWRAIIRESLAARGGSNG